MKLSQRDWVQLSAYLDGELNPKEMEQLRNRIAGNPGLRASLEELKTAKTVLQSTPRLQVPRNFSLTPTHLGIKKIQPVFNGYRLAAAMMSFLLIGVLILDYGSILFRGGFAPAMAPIAEELSFEKSADSAVEEIAEEPALMAIEAEGATGLTAEERSVQESTDAEAAGPEVMVEDSAALSQEAVEGLQHEEPAPPGTELDAAEADQTSPAFGDQIAADPPNTPDELMEQPEDGETVDQPQTNQVIPSPTLGSDLAESLEVTFSDEGLYRDPDQRQVPFIRIVEILLLLGAVGFGTAAWLKRPRFPGS